MAIFNVDLYEPIDAVVTADTTAYRADNATWPTADGGILVGATDSNNAVINANFITADIYEPVATAITADTAAYSADNTVWPTADGGILEGARDFADAEVISIALPVAGGIYRPRKPIAVVGYGYGVLPELEGEAIGNVGIAGRGRANFGRSGAAAGAVGVQAAAVGIFKGLSIAGKGTAGAAGEASGMIDIKLNGSAIGRHDDDEAAVMTFLLAA